MVVSGTGAGAGLLGSIGSIREKIEVDAAEPGTACVVSGSGGAAEDGTKAGARGSGIPARPKMLTPVCSEDDGGCWLSSSFQVGKSSLSAFAATGSNPLRKALPYAAWKICLGPCLMTGGGGFLRRSSAFCLQNAWPSKGSSFRSLADSRKAS